MRRADARNLIRFNTRMGMFICPSNRSNVVSFLHGYAHGRAGRCQFLEFLSRHIADKHHVEPDCRGWPGQVERLAEKYSLDWMETYLMVSSEILSDAIGAPKRRS